MATALHFNSPDKLLVSNLRNKINMAGNNHSQTLIVFPVILEHCKKKAKLR